MNWGVENESSRFEETERLCWVNAGSRPRGGIRSLEGLAMEGKTGLSEKHGKRSKKA